MNRTDALHRLALRQYDYYARLCASAKDWNGTTETYTATRRKEWLTYASLVRDYIHAGGTEHLPCF